MDRVRRRGAQRGFALQSHPYTNARTTIARHRDLQSAGKSAPNSTTGTARTLKKRGSVQSPSVRQAATAPFRSTLKEAAEATLLLDVIDASDPGRVPRHKKIRLKPGLLFVTRLRAGPL